MKKKSLAEQANRFLDEDYLTAPQPNTTFDPFSPNYGDSQKQAKAPVDDEKKPMETDVTKDVDKKEAPEGEEEKANTGFVKKSYTEISELFKDILNKTKNLDEKLDELAKGVDSASEEKVASMEGVSKQLYEDVEKFQEILKSVLEIINNIDDNESEEEETEVKPTTEKPEEEPEKEEKAEEPEAEE